MTVKHTPRDNHDNHDNHDNQERDLSTVVTVVTVVWAMNDGEVIDRHSQPMRYWGDRGSSPERPVKGNSDLVNPLSMSFL